MWPKFMTKTQLKVETEDQQSKVVQAYLDELLQEATEPEAEPEADPVASVVEKDVLPEVAVQTTTPVPAAQDSDLLSLEQNHRALTDISRALEKQHDAVDVASEAESDPLMLEAPSWMGQDVECLLFEIGQLKLAIPLSGLSSIQKPVKPLTRLFGQPEWYLGLFSHENAQIKVLDTLALVQAGGGRDYQKDPTKYVLIIQDFNWALAVDKLCSTHIFKADQVRWRSKLRQQSWLCGTVIDEMCALLDGQKLAYAVSQKPEAVALELAQLKSKN